MQLKAKVKARPRSRPRPEIFVLKAEESL